MKAGQHAPSFFADAIFSYKSPAFAHYIFSFGTGFATLHVANIPNLRSAIALGYAQDAFTRICRANAGDHTTMHQLKKMAGACAALLRLDMRKMPSLEYMGKCRYCMGLTRVETVLACAALSRLDMRKMLLLEYVEQMQVTIQLCISLKRWRGLARCYREER